MTLVIARRVQVRKKDKTYNRVSLSSDSRINLETKGLKNDNCVKVFSIPVKISEPAENNKEKIVYNNSLGLAVAGGFISAYTIKESISEILKKLQYVPNAMELSMEKIAEFVLKFFRKISFDFRALGDDNRLCMLILSGFCPKEKKVRIFEFSIDKSIHTEERYYHKEILKNDGIVFFGSGAKVAKEIYQSDSNLNEFQIIKKIIVEEKDDTVGGGIQYGDICCNRTNFEVFGVQDYSLNDDGTFKEYLHTLRGLTFYKDKFESDVNDFHISPTFKTPFTEEINKLL